MCDLVRKARGGSGTRLGAARTAFSVTAVQKDHPRPTAKLSKTKTATGSSDQFEKGLAEPLTWRNTWRAR